MATIPHVAQALQTVLTSVADSAARTTGFIQRVRRLTGALFVQTLVFGWLAHPAATYDDLIAMAATLGLTLTPAALCARFTPTAAACLFRVLTASLQQLIQADPVVIPLLDRFPAVYLHDSTTIALPDALAALWPGCGGSHGRVAAALKGQVRLELRSGALAGPILQPGRCSDRALAVRDRPVAGSLRIRDLGYWQLDTLAQESADDLCWLSRLYPGTTVALADGAPLDLVGWLADQDATFDVAVQLGAQHHLPARLLGVRVPQEVADQRRRRLRQEARAKGRTVSAARLALCAWTLVVTNVPVDQLSLDEALLLLRARWQIELLFKLWKSHGQIDQSRGQQPWRVLCEVYAKLIAMVVQHWLFLTVCWAFPDRSLPKAAKAVRAQIGAVAAQIGDLAQLIVQLGRLAERLRGVGRQTHRTKAPNTYQLLLACPAALT